MEKLMSNYDTNPVTKIAGFETETFSGYDAIVTELQRRCDKDKIRVVVCDMYPGVDEQEILRGLGGLQPGLIIHSGECAREEEAITENMQKWLTDDRVFGILTTDSLEDYFDTAKIEKARNAILKSAQGQVLIIGVGASLIPPPAEKKLFVYFDMERWEIQLRYRRGMSNWKCSNHDAPLLSKYKRGYFVEWRLADKHKKSVWNFIDYYADTQKPLHPGMVTKTALDTALDAAVHRPFRMVPYFDPGVWGGQWMKEQCNLDKDTINYAWSFDGVPEENTLQLGFGNFVLRTPCQNLVLFYPHELLGESVHARFGTEFPIRFDMLDTIGGQNLSLQVHPLTEYIQEKFNMRYTQDESYYILDTANGETYVYLGIKTGIDKDEMIRELYEAEAGTMTFPAEKYVNMVPVKKHDHVMIPAGTVHCSGKNTMALEISATPYIFTFKLWDWSRTGLDGIPRPVHLEHGIKNIQWDRDTEWVQNNLVHGETVIEENKTLKKERTGLHKREFIDTFRYTFSEPVICETGGSVNVLNLVEGDEIVIDGMEYFSGQQHEDFTPLTVHYAETFIVPASIQKYRISPGKSSHSQKFIVIQALVRT